MDDQRCWVQMFQFPVLAFIIAIATDATQAAGVYCLQSNSKDYGHLWVSWPKNVTRPFSPADNYWHSVEHPINYFDHFCSRWNSQVLRKDEDGHC